MDDFRDYLLTDQCCSCHTGNPPCSFCTDTFECDSCEEREFSGEVEENDYGFLCETCTELYEQSKKPRLLMAAAEEMFYAAGLLAAAATFHDILIHFIK